MMKEDAVVGVTSNPTIFQKAISHGRRVRRAADGAARRRATTRRRSSSQLALQDVARRAATLLRPVCDEGDGSDGFVSLEVDPTLAYDREGTFDAGDAPARVVDRAEPLREDPGDEAGPRRDRGLHRARARSINVTLIFSLERYAEVVEAYLRGLERLVAGGGDPTTVALGRELLRLARRHRGRQAARRDRRQAAPSCSGKLAIANAKLAYQHYQRGVLRAALGVPRRQGRERRSGCLWASTSTKNPEYRDVMYVEELIGPRHGEHDAARRRSRAFQDHGEVRGDTVMEGVDEAHELLDELARGRRRLRRRHRDARARGRAEVRRLVRRSCSTASRAKRGRARRRRAPSMERAELIDRIWERDATRLDRRRRGAVARLARRAAPDARATSPELDGVRGRGRRRRHRRRRPARHGRLVPRARGAPAHVRQSRRFHVLDTTHPAGDPRARGDARPRAHALRLGVEVRLDARDALAHRLLLGADGQARRAVRRDHRSRLRARAARARSAASAASSPASRRSAAATRRSRRSGSCRRR